MGEVGEWFLGRNSGPCFPECTISELGETCYRPGIILSSNFETIEHALFEYPWLAILDDVEGNTALHIVAQYDHDDVVQILLNYGAKISPENIYGARPIDVAYHFMSTRTISLIYNYAIILIQRRWREILARKNEERILQNRIYFLENGMGGMMIYD